MTWKRLTPQDLYRLPEPELDVRAEMREVVRDIDGKPHVFVRVKVTGGDFRPRAEEPFLVVGDAVSLFVTEDPDGTTIRAYFDQPLAPVKRVSFGHGLRIEQDFDVELGEAERLDRAKLPKGIVDLGEEPG